MRKIVVASTILLVSFGVAMADEFNAVIRKVEGNKVTFAKVVKKKTGDDMTLPTAEKLSVVKGGKFNQETKKFEGGEAIEGGLKAEPFTKIGEKGLSARITTDEDNKNITAIRLTVKKKKKDAK